MVKIITNSSVRAVDANGSPVPNAKLYLYNAGTTTAVTTYSDLVLSVQNTTPIISDSSGFFGPIYVADGTYKIDVQSSAGASLPGFPSDNVVISSVTGVTQSQLDLKSDLTHVTTELALKADATSLALKADTTYVDTELADKADTTYVDTTFSGLSSNRVVDVPSGHQFGNNRSAGVILDDGTLRVWGLNVAGQLGQGPTGITASSEPLVVPFPRLTSKPVKWARASHENIVLMDDGSVYSFGYNQSGVLGHGNTTQTYLAKKITAFDGITVTDISMGSRFAQDYHHALFLTSTGALYACGSNSNGQLGDGTTTDRSTPVLLSKTNWSSILSVGSKLGRSYGIDTTGALYAWGFNGTGALGDGTTTDRSTPVHVNSFGGVSVVEVTGTMDHDTQGYGHTAARTTDGKIFTWGYNTSGQLGDGTTTQATVPQEITALGVDNDLVVAGGGEYGQTYVLKTAGSVYATGSNSVGELGIGNTTNQTSFQEMTGSDTGSNIVQILVFGASPFGGVAILYADNEIKSCGYNASSQLGDGTRTASATLVQFPFMVHKPTKIVAIGKGTETGIGIVTSEGFYYQTGAAANYQTAEPYAQISGVARLVTIPAASPSGGPQGPAGDAGDAGPNGTNGLSFEWEGVYSSGTAYVVGDTVFNQNSSWICVSAVTGTAPPTLPTESNSNWALMAKNGADGADGDGAGDLLSTNNLSDLANSSTARTNLGLSIGADVQAYSAAIDGTTASYLVAEQTKLAHVSVTQAVDLDQMETDIAAMTNGMVYKDTWDASSGSFPGSGLAQIGWFYYVSVGGTVDSVTFSAGDNIVAIVNDSSSTVYAANWSKHDQTDAVQSVAGKTGTVTLALADITDAGDAAGLDEATTANFRANVSDRLLSTDQVWLAAAEVSLTDAASIAVDFSTGLNFGVTIASNRTLANPTNTKVGQAGFIRIAQDATGSRTLAFGTNYKFSAGTAPTMTTTANAEDLLFYSVLSSTKILINSVLDVK